MDAAELQREVEALDRVLFRLASVTDERMVVVLQQLLPQLLRLVPKSTTEPLQRQLQDKVLEVVSHIKARLKGIPAPALPVVMLADLLAEPTTPVLAQSFALLFIETGFDAASVDDRASVMSRMVRLLDGWSRVQQDTFFRLLLRALPASASMLSLNASDQMDTSKSTADIRSECVDILLSFLLDVILFQGATASADNSQPGLMGSRMDRLECVKVTKLPKDSIYEAQMHTLKLVKELDVVPGLKYPIYVAGCSSFHHAVKSLAEQQLSRVLKYEEAQLEDPLVVRRLIALALGSQATQAAGHQVDQVFLGDRTPLPDASLLHTMELLRHSKAATRVLPLILQLLCQLMFGSSGLRPLPVVHKVKLAGVKMAQWTLNECEEAILQAFLGPVLFSSLFRVISASDTESDRSNDSFEREFRREVYECIGILASRAPGVVSGNIQTFQVMLVRCLIEEEEKSGAHALKAFTALARAFAQSASSETQSKVRSELVDMLRGDKLFDKTKNYVRVRSVIALWCAELMQTNVSVEVRFSLFKLLADADEDVKKNARRALYARPLPSAPSMVSYLCTRFPKKDLKSELGCDGAVACFSFCEHLLEEDSNEDAMNDIEAHKFVELMFHTLADDSAEAASRPDFLDDMGGILVKLCANYENAVCDVVVEEMPSLLKLTAVSTSRGFHLSIADLVKKTASTHLSARSNLIDVIHTTGTTDISPVGHFYVQSGILTGLCDSQTKLDHESTTLLGCYSSLINTLHDQVDSVSKFQSIPRSEKGQDAVMTNIVGIVDAVGLSGPLTLLADANQELWMQQKKKMVNCFLQIFHWDFKSVIGDDNLKSKLSAAKKAAIRAIGWSFNGHNDPIQLDLILTDLVEVLITMPVEQDDEALFVVGEALVALGTQGNIQAYGRALRVMDSVIVRTSSSNKPRQRRAATVWLACICAAGLATRTSSSWKTLLNDSSLAPKLVQIHEFLVDMLNDSNDVAKESAVKGLAYLRLCAPTTELGSDFSNTLFRRLRCFRAFVQSTSSNSPNGNSTGDDEPTPGTTPATTTGGDVVENAAYREVSNVAADVGDSEIMYSLLYLSTTNSIWQSFASAPSLLQSKDYFSFAGVDVGFRKHVVDSACSTWAIEGDPRAKKIVPWLYLLKFHSNPRVAEVLGNLWNFAKGHAASSYEEKALLKQHHHTLMQFILARLETSRNFKYREASCLALIELLNGADADIVRDDFLRLWKATSRAVDDVMEAVCLVGLKLFRFLGELSLRVAAVDTVCRTTLLEYLVSDGMVSKNTVCRALSIDILLRLVKTLSADAVQPQLTEMILRLLEYLSSLEMPELQYAQFHVENKDQLERLRITLSQSGPVGQLLELCTAKLKEISGSPESVKIVESLVKGTGNLLRFGVGLNTRVGTANFVATLAVELPFELRKCGGAEALLVNVLTPFVGARTSAENDQYGDDESNYGQVSSSLADGLVVQSYCRAAAYLSALVDQHVVRTYARDGIFAYSSNDQRGGNVSPDSAMKHDPRYQDCTRFLLVSAIATKELVAKCPPATSGEPTEQDWYSAFVFPGAFLGQYATSPALKTTWTAVLEDLPPSVKYANASLTSLCRYISRFLVHPAWDTRRQAAVALAALLSPTSSYLPRFQGQQLDQLWGELLQAVPGRLWKGKGTVLEALVAVAIASRLTQAEIVIKLLLDECDRARKNNDFEYLENALQCLGRLAAMVPDAALRLETFDAIRSRLEVWSRSDDAQERFDTVVLVALPPLVVKQAFDSMSEVWTVAADSDGDHEATASRSLRWLCEAAYLACFNIWSIRRSVFGALKAVVAHCPAKSLLHAPMIDTIVNACCGEWGLQDRKYSMIRVAAGGVLVALVSRRVPHDLVLLVQPYKERILREMEPLSASEEPTEKQVASQLLESLNASEQ